MNPLLADNSLKSLADTLGPLPDGDIPVAWYCSTHPEVLAKYEEWRVAHQGWRDRFAELCAKSGFAYPGTQVAMLGDDAIAGLLPPDEPTSATWWRKDRAGYWVPRKRTKAERSSEVFQRFQACRRVPSVVRYLPGLPHSLWVDGPGLATTVYPVKVRKPGQAVLVFLGADPDRAQASTPFTLSEHWSRMKLSTYHMLKERQAAEKQDSPARFNPTPYVVGVKR